MADIFGSTEPPRWLQAIARPPERGELGGLLGTALAGGVKSLTEDKGFFDATQEARMTQQDPMWPLKAKQLQVQTKAIETATTAKWLEAERKSSLFDSMNDSMVALGPYDGSGPVPAGIKTPAVLLQANGIRQRWLDAQNKVALTEIAAAKADAQIANMQALVGIKTEAQKLAEQKLEAANARGEQDRLSRETVAGLNAQNRLDVEKIRSLDRKDARGNALSRQHFIDRHLNTVFKQMVDANTDTKKPVTLGDATKLLSETFDTLPPDNTGTTNAAKDPLGLFK